MTRLLCLEETWDCWFAHYYGEGATGIHSVVDVVASVDSDGHCWTTFLCRNDRNAWWIMVCASSFPFGCEGDQQPPELAVPLPTRVSPTDHHSLTGMRMVFSCEEKKSTMSLQQVGHLATCQHCAWTKAQCWLREHLMKSQQRSTKLNRQITFESAVHGPAMHWHRHQHRQISMDSAN